MPNITHRAGASLSSITGSSDSNAWKRYTSAQVIKVLQLVDQKVKAEDIALRMGRSRSSIYQLVRRAKLNGWTVDNFGTRYTKKDRAERMVWLFEHGVSLAEIARIFDTSTASVINSLNWRGLDADERALVLEELPAVARVNRQVSPEIFLA
jgi:transposase